MSAIGYYIFYFIVRMFNLLPMRLVYFISDFFFFILYYLIPYRKKVVYQNLKNSFPEKSEEEIKLIMRKFYHYFCDMFLETIMLYGISEKELLERVKFKNPELLQDLYASGKSSSIILGHYCNWEWLNIIAVISGYKTLAIYKPLSNRYFNKFMVNLREKFGLVAVPMANIAREVINAKSESIPVAVFFVADQSPIKSEIKSWITFLNQETGVFAGVEKIATKHDHAVVFMKMTRLSRGYYETEFISLFDDLKGVDSKDITVKHIKILEEIIREKPEYWLWTHRRWKYKRD